MKAIITIFVCFISTSAFAKSISCEMVSTGHHSSLEVRAITLEAVVASAKVLRNVSLTLDYPGDPTDRGEADVVKARKGYNPTKLKDTNIFDLALLDTSEKLKGKSFDPYDQCEFTVNLPKDIDQRQVGSSIDGIHLLSHCDQNGGLDILTCAVK